MKDLLHALPSRLPLLAFCGALLLTALQLFAQSNPTGAHVRVLRIDGAIGPAIGSYVTQGILGARDAGAALVVLEMDTPGGLDGAMRSIIQVILDADVPVATWVAPQGARAASAGTYILYASHVAAMAPATNLGAATPVQIGMPALPNPTDDGEEQAAAATEGSAMERKIINDATAYIRGLAERHGRNTEWAVRAVTEAASLSATEALDEGVIDLIAEDHADLLAQMQGRTVTVRGNTVTLDVTGLPLRQVGMDWRARFLTVVTNPNLILILGMIGIYGLILEFYNPGFGLGGTVGIICLLLAGYGLQLLPINYAGLGLILLGIALIIAEALQPSFGLFGLGGLVAFTVGGVMLVDTEVDAFRLSLPLLAALAVATAALLIYTLRAFIKLRQVPAVSGLHTLIGQLGESVADFTGTGTVKVSGELWQASCDTPLRKGEQIEVLDVNGLHLRVQSSQHKRE